MRVIQKNNRAYTICQKKTKKMIDFIQNHAEVIRSYQQPAINWAYTQTGRLKSNVQYALDNGALQGIDFTPLSREDVADHFRNNLYRGFIATMLWGNKNRKFHEVVDIPVNEIVAKLNNVKTLIEKDNIHDAFLSMYSGNNKIENVGISFFTKLLYFISKAFAPQNTPLPLILDSHMCVAHCAILLDECNNGHQLYRWRDGYGLTRYNSTGVCAINIYEDYINRMHNIADSIGTSAETLEAFLFSFHPATQTSFIYQEVYNRRNMI